MLKGAHTIHNLKGYWGEATIGGTKWNVELSQSRIYVLMATKGNFNLGRVDKAMAAHGILGLLKRQWVCKGVYVMCVTCCA